MERSELDTPFAAYRGTDPYVFVCYSHKDAAEVYPELSWLRDQGVNVWYDEGISGGKIWRTEIGSAIQAARKLLFYVSSSSMASDHCSREINFALDEAIEVVPIYLEDVALTMDLKLGLGRVQALQRFHDPRYRHHLLRVAQTQIDIDDPPVEQPMPGTPKRRWLQVAATTLVIALAGMLWFLSPTETPEAMAHAVRLGIAPFTPASVEVAGLEYEIERRLSASPGLIVRVTSNSNRAENYRLAGHIQGEVLRLEIGDQNGVDVGVWTTVLDQDLSNVADKISRSILVKLGRADEVVERFQNTIQPDVFRSYLAATALLRNSHTADASQRAEDIYLNVLAAEPHYAPAHAGLCSTYLIRYSQSMKEGLFLSAEQHCHRALTLDERDPTVYMALGMLYRETGQPTKAINSYHKALSIAPYSTDAMRGLAETLDRSGATAEANQWYLDAIQVEPSHWENYQALGKHQFGNGQFDLAIESFQTALSLAPDEIGVSNNIGAAHFMAENFQQAVTYWQQVAEREPSPQIYANLAISYFYQRQFNQALAMYESAHRAAPDDFRWVGHIGEVLNVTKSAAAQPYFQQAIELATGQLNIDPDNGLTLSDVATYYAGLGKGNDVHSLLDRALEDNAEDIDVVYNAAVAYSRLGEAELALIMVEKLRSLGYAESLLALDANFDGLYSTK